MIREIVAGIILFITGGTLMQFINWLGNKNERKYQEEIKKEEAEQAKFKSKDTALDAIQESYRKFIEDYNCKFESLIEDVTLLKSKVKTLRNELDNERKENKEMRKQYICLQSQYNILQKDYDNIKISFEECMKQKD